MQYMLDNLVRFRVSSGIISSASHHIELPVAASRLLNELILNNNELITRDYLLREVWEKFNLTPSNSNLNRNISLIRKAFENFGIHDAIKTLPKQGFILRVQIAKVNEFSTEQQPEYTCNKYNSYFKLKNIILFFSCFLGGVPIFVFLYINHLSFFNTSGFHYFEKYGMCDVYISSDIDNTRIESLISSSEGQKKMQPCEKDKRNIYIDDNKLPVSDMKNEEFLAICGRNGNNEKIRCENYVVL